jgi:hypothetical protein
MASPERKNQELKSGRSAVVDLIRQDPELARFFEEIENDGSWESLLETFENGKHYSDKKEFKVIELLENLVEQNPPEAEKLLETLAIVAGQKYGDLRGRLGSIQNRLESAQKRLEHVGKLSAFLPDPSKDGGGRSKSELEKEAEAMRPTAHGRRPKHRALAIDMKDFAAANGGGDADSGP